MLSQLGVLFNPDWGILSPVAVEVAVAARGELLEPPAVVELVVAVPVAASRLLLVLVLVPAAVAVAVAVMLLLQVSPPSA